MNRKQQLEILRYWDLLRTALMHLGLHRVRKNSQEIIKYEPACKRLAYVSGIKCVIIEIEQSQFPDWLLFSDLNRAKARAALSTYVGDGLKIAVTDRDVCFTIPALIGNETEVAFA